MPFRDHSNSEVCVPISLCTFSTDDVKNQLCNLDRVGSVHIICKLVRHICHSQWSWKVETIDWLYYLCQVEINPFVAVS